MLIQTPRFIIQKFTPADRDAYMALYDDERVTVHLRKKTKAEHEEIFQSTLSDYQAGKTLTRWGLFTTDNKELIGNCLLRNFYDYPNKVELGYSLHHKYWGKGIATEVARSLISYGFSHTDADEIVAVTKIENISSQKVLLKAGMERREDFIKEDEILTFFSIARPY